MRTKEELIMISDEIKDLEIKLINIEPATKSLKRLNFSTDLALKDLDQEYESIMNKMDQILKKYKNQKKKASNIAIDVKNKGHLFEEQVAYSLLQVGHSITGIEGLNHYPLLDSSLQELFSKIEIQKFRKISDIENRNSISSDFIGNNYNISCKYNTKALKHPPLGTLFAKILNTDRKKLLLEFESFKDNKQYYKEEGKKILGSDFYKKMTQFFLEKINGIIYTPELTMELYNFLIGQERPIIITAKGKNKIEVFNTKDINSPESFKIFMNEKNQLIISFDNGISFKHRIKTAINSKTEKYLSQIFKEEFTLI